MGKKKLRTTDKQRTAVDNLVSGKYPTAGKAMRAAGYSKPASENPQTKLFDRLGVQQYLKKLDDTAKRRLDKFTIREEVMEGFHKGTKAMKTDKEGNETPDWHARYKFLNKFAEFFGWSKDEQLEVGRNQYNFFMFSKEVQDDFNQKFEQFLMKEYHGD